MRRAVRACLVGVLFVVLVVGRPVMAQTGDGIGLALTNVYLEGDRLDFDIDAFALGTNTMYLGFSDVVLRFESNSLRDTARLRLWPASSQLLSSEQQRIDGYELRYILRIEQRQGFDYVYIGIDPPRFRDLQQFVATVAQLDRREGFHRIGRFSLTGLVQLPDTLNFYQAEKGMKTQVYHFLPREDFKAALASIQCKGVNLMEQEIEFFEAVRQDDQVQLVWKQGETGPWQALSVERSYDARQWEELAFTPVGITNLTDSPNPPKLLEGKSLVYYRLQIRSSTGKNIFSNVRMLEF
ncbi:MAG: hypothetical protein Q8J69_10340 [Sphingobacteriaceae bacterium]|nr:hypothetical protein [Sphingobacteriaceae bacterium]